MGTHLDLDDVVAGHPLAAKQLAALRIDLIACRPSVRSDLAHWERTAMMHTGNETISEMANGEASRLLMLLDRIDAVKKEDQP